MMPNGAKAIVIGASAGAVQALSQILPRLPATYPLPVVIVVHVPADPSGLVALFASKCAIRVREPDDKEPIESACVYFAPPGYHMLVEDDRTIALSLDEPVLYSRPSIDVLFQSAADSYGEGLIGVMLTGANEDGAVGSAAIIDAGGTVLVEDPEHAFADTMPRAALARCPSALTLSLDAIADRLAQVGTI
ncbi:two-component system chemotaxis response regulator CheB [Novosphingobium hassiacum]|uniref:protein-glutamate methylesterase n=1 Tax=Novosphingobium hassiacum TaxID=173676 RepID=A0A7W5ZZT0_9SPHN|nr:chemotaxis protein CheB [Novosphingobium hassiacum]MBB3860670.1 two-component system chemotaxis response regulator CheB [Novosphingobium hassiacum]